MALDRCVLHFPAVVIEVESVRDSKVRRDAMMTVLPTVGIEAEIGQDSRVRRDGMMTALRMAEIAVEIVRDSRVRREVMATGLPSVVGTIGQGSKVRRAAAIMIGLRMAEIVVGIVQDSRVRQGVMAIGLPSVVVMFGQGSKVRRVAAIMIGLRMVEIAVGIVQDSRARRGAMVTSRSSLVRVGRNIRNRRAAVIGLHSVVAIDRHSAAVRIDLDSKVRRGAETDLLSAAGERIGQDFRVHREAAIGPPSVAVTIGRSSAVEAIDQNLVGRPETVEADRLSVVAMIARNLTGQGARADLVQNVEQDRLHGKRGQILGRKGQAIDRVRGNRGASLPVKVAENLGAVSYLSLLDLRKVAFRGT